MWGLKGREERDEGEGDGDDGGKRRKRELVCSWFLSLRWIGMIWIVAWVQKIEDEWGRNDGQSPGETPSSRFLQDILLGRIGVYVHAAHVTCSDLWIKRYFV